MSMHVANLVIGNTVIDLSNTTPEQVIYDRNLPLRSRPEVMPIPTPDINKFKIHSEHLKKMATGEPHLKSYMGDMITPTVHYKTGYRIRGTEKLHRKSSYVSQFLGKD